MNKFSHVFDNLINKPTLLNHTPIFKTNLHDATALFISGYFERVLNDGVVDWLFVFIFCENVEAGLDDVVARNVDGEIQNMVLNGKLKLLAPFVCKGLNLIEKQLQRSGSVMIHSNSRKLLRDHVHNAIKLIGFRNLYQLLTQIICEKVHHQRDEIFDQNV